MKVMATRPYYIRATFPPLRHSVHQLLERHHCIHRLINHVYTKGPNNLCYSLPHDSHQRVSSYWLRVKRAGAGRMRAPSGPKFLHFHAVFGKNWPNNRLPPPFGISTPSSGKSWIGHWIQPCKTHVCLHQGLPNLHGVSRDFTHRTRVRDTYRSTYFDNKNVPNVPDLLLSLNETMSITLKCLSNVQVEATRLCPCTRWGT